MKRERTFSLLALFNEHLPLPTGDDWRRNVARVRVMRAVILREMEPTEDHKNLVLELSKKAMESGWSRQELLDANAEALELRKTRFGGAVVSLSSRRAVKLDLAPERQTGLTTSQKKA